MSNRKQILLVGGNDCAKRASAGPLLSQWDVTSARDGLEASAHLDNRKFDAVVTDERLPDMDGFRLLDIIQDRHPETQRLIFSDLADPRIAVRCARNSHRCIPKPWDGEVLRGSIERAFSLGIWLSNPAVRSLVRKMTIVPSPPDLYFAVVRALNAPEKGTEEVIERAGQDPAITARLLKIANSAALGLHHEVVDLGEAIAYLGLETTRSLILLAHTFSYCDRRSVSGFSIERLWQHSLLTGRLARRIAREEQAPRKILDEAFLAGILHDIGELLLAVNMPAEYGHAIADVRAQRCAGNQIPVWQAEQGIVGAAHTEIGAELMANWNLPLTVVEAIALHHQPAQLVSMGFSPLTAVHAADVFAEELSPSPESLEILLIDSDYLAHIGLSRHIDAWRDACKEEIES